MAGDFSTVNVILGGGAQNQVVTEAGVYFIQASLGPAGTPYWVYDGTNLVGNVPTGKGLKVQINGGSDSGGLLINNSTGAALTYGTHTATMSSAGLTIANGYIRADTTGSQLADLTLTGTGDLTIPGNHGIIGPVAAGRTLSVPNATNQPVDIGNANLTAMAVRLNTAQGSTLQANIVAANTITMGGQVDMAHIAGGSTAVVPGDPASVGRVTIGLGAGTTSSGTAVTASGHDMAMRVGVTVNSTGTVSQPILLGSWAASYNRPPFMVESPGNAATAAIAVAQAPFLQTTTSGWSIIANTTGLSAGTYVWYLSGVIQ